MYKSISILATIAAALGLAGRGPAGEPPRDDLPAESQLDGAWRLVSYKSDAAQGYKKVPDGLEQVKLVAGGRFVSTLVRQGKAVQMVGGRCAAGGEQYVERIQFVLDKQDDWMVSVPGVFKWKLAGGTWCHEGVIRGRRAEARIFEVWERLKADEPPGPPEPNTGFQGAWRRAPDRPPRSGDGTDASRRGEQIKLVAGGQFVWTFAEGGKLINAAGGRFSAKSNGYSETIDYVAANDWLLSKTATFTGKVRGGTWRHEGGIHLDTGVAPIEETWVRVR